MNKGKARMYSMVLHCSWRDQYEFRGRGKRGEGKGERGQGTVERGEGRGGGKGERREEGGEGGGEGEEYRYVYVPSMVLVMHP